MVERIRHVFECQNCGSANTCDLREERRTLAVTCAGCSEPGDPQIGEWELVDDPESVTLDRDFGPIDSEVRKAIQRGELP